MAAADRRWPLIVLGAGPAGVVLAKMLRDYGHEALLIGRPRPYPALEGLSERALAGLRHCGCERAAAVARPAQREAHWNGERFAGNREWLLERQTFDAALLADARAAGLTLREQTARRLWRDADGWRVELADGSVCHGDALVEARGRAAPAGRDTAQGPATVALGRRWRLPPGAPRTRVAPFAAGWFWLADDGAGNGLGQLFLSVEDAKLPPRPRLVEYYRRRLRDVDEAAGWLQGARPHGPVYARYAQPRRALPDRRAFAVERYARVGDAAFAPDPLSGHGLFQALGGALTLAAVLNTRLRQPESTALAWGFYRDRLESDFLRMARVGRDFYRLERRWSDRPFWRQRGAWPDELPAHPTAPRAPSLEYRPVNDAGLIRLREVVVTAGQPRGVWQVAGVPLAELWRLQRRETGLDPTRLAQHLQCPPEAVMTALHWLRQNPPAG